MSWQTLGNSLWSSAVELPCPSHLIVASCHWQVAFTMGSNVFDLAFWHSMVEKWPSAQQSNKRSPEYTCIIMYCSCIWWHTMTLFGSCTEESGLIWAPCIVLHCVTGSIWYAGQRATLRRGHIHAIYIHLLNCNAIQCHPFHLLPNKRAIIDTRTDLSGRRNVSMASKTTLDDAQMRGHLLKMLSV